MTEWIEVTLADVCAAAGGGIQTGPFGSQLHASDYVANGTPSVMPQNIGDNRISVAGIARVSDADLDRLAKYTLRPGDIVYSRRGDVERRALVRDENDGWLCGTGCLRVRIPNQDIYDSRFISYALGLSESREWIVRHAVGATMLNLNTRILGGVPLRVPSVTQQRAIAEVLGALDDKIAANYRVTRNADGLCAALVAQATANGPRAQLRDLMILHYGKSLPAAQRQSGSVTVIGSGGPTGTHDTPLVDRPGVVLGRKGTVGAVHWCDSSHYPIDTTYYVEPLGELSSEALFYMLRSMPLSELNSDSAVPGLNREEAYAQSTNAPDSPGRLTEALRPKFDLMAALRRESAALAATRNELLPLLMSGKIRVKDAEKSLEGVL